MPFTNLRNAYEFDPQDYDYQSAGGLPGLLRDAMRRQGLQQGNQTELTASAAPDPHSDAYGSPQGLFGRLLSMQTSQGSPIGMMQEASSSDAAAVATPVQYRIRVPLGPFRPYPIFSADPQAVPQIPMPHLHLPEPWPTIGKIVQLLPGLMRDRLIKEDDNETCPNCQAEEDLSTDGAKKKPGKPDDPKPPLPFVLPSPPVAPEGIENGGWPSQEECDEEKRQARKDCAEFMAGGNWKENGGPWAKFRGAPFNFDRCVKSRMSVACGGDREAEKRRK